MANTKIKDYMGCEIFVTEAGKFWAGKGDAEAVGLKASLRAVEMALEKGAMPAETFEARKYEFPYRESFTVRGIRIEPITVTRVVKPRKGAWDQSFKFKYVSGRFDGEVAVVYKVDTEIAADIEKLGAMCEEFNTQATALYEPIKSAIEAIRVKIEASKITAADLTN